MILQKDLTVSETTVGNYIPDTKCYSLQYRGAWVDTILVAKPKVKYRYAIVRMDEKRKQGMPKLFNLTEQAHHISDEVLEDPNMFVLSVPDSGISFPLI